MSHDTRVFLGFMFFIVILFTGMFAVSGYTTYVRAECVKSYATSARSADDIMKICGVPH